MKQPFHAAFILLITSQSFGQNFNRPVPQQIPLYEFVQNDTTHHGYYMTAPFKPGALGAPVKPAMILDANGYLFWYMPVNAQNLFDFKYHPAQQLYSFINYKSAQDIRFTLMNTDFELIDSFSTTNGFLPDLHEFNLTRDNTYLLAGISDSIMDLSLIFNGVPGSNATNVIGYVVQEFDQDHQLLFQWNSNDHIHPAFAYAQYGYQPANFDYCHGNTIAEDVDGDLLLSFRNLNAVYKINRTTGQIEWRLGGKSNSFTFANDNGFSGQHDVQRLPNGNISLFDNANMAQFPKISRAVEYSLDTVNWVATRVWEYQYDPGFLSIAMGNHQTTESRHHLVNYGFNYRPKPSFVLVDDNGIIATELFFQDSFMSYRSFIFDLPVNELPRPTISCSHNNGIITLSAPPGYDRYEWSTGESSAAITVQQTDTYQLWVNHGMGMLGSEPFFLNDLDNACSVSATKTPDSIDNQRVIGYYDLLGRKISIPVKGGLYVVRYENGHARVQLWTE